MTEAKQTYGFTACDECLGFGVAFLPSERAKIAKLFLKHLRAGNRTLPASVPLELPINMHQCCNKCKGTGWLLVPSTTIRHNHLPDRTIER